MMEFRVVPLSLEIRGYKFKRGDLIYMHKIYIDGVPMYRMTPPFYRLKYRPEEYKWFTQKQLDGMQPHWITQQEELPL